MTVKPGHMRLEVYLITFGMSDVLLVSTTKYNKSGTIKERVAALLEASVGEQSSPCVTVSQPSRKGSFVTS